MISHKNYIDEIKKRVGEVIESKHLILGPEVWKLEEEISQYLGVKYAIGVNSGTDALIYSLKSLGIGTGDEVICPVFTFTGTAEAIVWAGGRPVFADIEPQTLNINPDIIEQLITQRTRAIIPVHLYGQSADIDKIMKIARKHKLKVIEDTAQAFGAEYCGQKAGTFGDTGCLSFFPSKILGAFGDGGMVLTNNAKLATAIKMMRIDGASEAKKIYYDHQIIGGSSRLHEIQAAVLRVQLKYLRQNLEYRQKIVSEYNGALKGIGDLILPLVHEGNYHVYNFYVVRTGFRNQLKDFLVDNGIETSIMYPKPLHFLDAYKFLNYKNCDFPEAEKAAKEVLALPVGPFVSLKKVREVTSLVKIFFSKVK